MIKTFDFISFSEWYNGGKSKVVIGEYWVEIIKECIGVNQYLCSCTLSCTYIPSNKSTNKLFSTSIRFNECNNNLEDLQMWYEMSTQTANLIFENHLKTQYFVNWNEIAIAKIINNPYASGICDRCLHCTRDFCDVQSRNIEDVFICNKFIED